jgi:hypothetical protein
MAAVMEVKVPDIGDFKDVPVIEVMSHASHISGADAFQPAARSIRRGSVPYYLRHWGQHGRR